MPPRGILQYPQVSQGASVAVERRVGIVEKHSHVSLSFHRLHFDKPSPEAASDPRVAPGSVPPPEQLS